MARTEQKYVIDRETLAHLLAVLRDGITRGASDREIWDQTREILNPDNRRKTDQALKEKTEGRVKRFKNAEEMISDLKSR
jgi:hypothetical protein